MMGNGRRGGEMKEGDQRKIHDSIKKINTKLIWNYSASKQTNVLYKQ